MPRFNEKEADDAVLFIEGFLKHTKSPWNGQPFELAPWQAKMVRDVFGRQVYSKEFKRWVRQIRTVYLEIPRKNGKSALGAAIALKLLFADNEVGAEIYSVAEDEKQAAIVFNVARDMVNGNPALKGRCKVGRSSIEVTRSRNIYRVIPADAKGAHGLNPHGVIFDELHTQKNRDLWDVMTSGQGARTQPLIWAFSTAGTDRTSICWEQHDYGERVNDGTLKDPRFYYVRFGLEEGDDWQSDDIWKKVNPALGTFLSLDFLTSEYQKAKISPAKQNSFRNLYTNEWTQQVERWIDMDAWDASGAAGMGATEPDLAGQVCYGGLHLGPVGEMAAWVLAFPDPADIEKVRVLPRFFCPAREIQENRQYGAQFQQWRDQNYLIETPGDVTDYGRIREQILADAGRFDLRQINLRVTFKGAELSSTLVDYFGEDNVLFFNPNWNGFAPSTHELERLLGAQTLWHSGHPILRWMADNAAAKTNENGDAKPDQALSQGSIAGIVGLCMALDLALQHRVGGGDPMVGIIDF